MEGDEKSVSFEKIQELNNPIAYRAITKLIAGAYLNEEELTLLANLTLTDMANIAIRITSNKLMSLRDPEIILNAAATIYGNITANLEHTEDLNKAKAYQQNMETIKMMQSRNHTPGSR